LVAAALRGKFPANNLCASPPTASGLGVRLLEANWAA
jgi:hypothetical protein